MSGDERNVQKQLLIKYKKIVVQKCRCQLLISIIITYISLQSTTL